jgi:acyl-CoA synthetase (AMP-forming)/AMP-acid ligase II
MNAWWPNGAIPRWNGSVPCGRAEPAPPRSRPSELKWPPGARPGDGVKGGFLGGTHSVRPLSMAKRVPRNSVFTGWPGEAWSPTGTCLDQARCFPLRACGARPLYLVDRKKDVIISGGVNVYPRDIEEVIVRHPAVREAAVFGIPDDKWGEAPVAAVVLNLPEAVSREELMRRINEHVEAKFQRVKDVVILGDFPRNVAGKTLKREIREEYLRSLKKGGE